MNKQKYYSNPVLPGFNPDPSICRVGEDYYMVTSTFQYFPCVTIYHSKDLIHWEQIGSGIDNSDILDLTEFYDGCGIWAPDISYYNGEFYLSICLVQLAKDRSVNVRGNYIMKSKSPEGPYSQPVQITFDGNDPSHFVDEDGSHYMLYAAGIPKGQGVKIVKLNDECTKVVEGPMWLEFGEEKSAPEGPHLIKKDDYYYLIIATSKSDKYQGHHGLVARSKKIYGPYEESPYKPFMAQFNKEAVIQHAGHGKLVDTQKGEWWIPYLCQRRIDGYSTLGRETAIDRVTWTEDGWPILNDLNGPSDTNTVPDLPENLYEVEDTDSFDREKLSLKWLFVRNPEYKQFSLEERKGYLRLYTQLYDLNDIKCRNIIVQREISHHSQVTTKMQFNPQHSGEEAGVVCYYDSSAYIKFSITLDRELKIKVEEMRKNNKKIIKILEIEKEEFIYLRIETHKLKRTFYYSIDNENWTTIVSMEDCSFLSDQGTSNWGFTGTMIGVFAANGYEEVGTPVDFKWFSYKVIDEV